MDTAPVTTVADARTGLSRIPRRAGRERALPLLERLRAKRDRISRIAAMNTLVDVRVFGSVARGDETDASDLDLLVGPTVATTLFDLAQFAIDMEGLVERKVDVVSSRSLDPQRDSQILAEAGPCNRAD